MAFNNSGLRVDEATGFVDPGSNLDTSMRKADYVTDDTAAVVETAGYFNDAVGRLPKNTVICAVMDIGNTPVLKNYIVTVNDGTAVTVALQATAAG